MSRAMDWKVPPWEVDPFEKSDGEEYQKRWRKFIWLVRQEVFAEALAERQERLNNKRREDINNLGRKS